MDGVTDDGSESRFSAYVDGLVEVIGHADRASPLRDYCLGLLMPGERKSVEPMAAVTAPARVAAQHQSLLHFVGNAPWLDERVLARVRDLVLPTIERRGPIEAWIIDDTGFPKKGRHSVGVARQYCGQLGKQDNCQVAVTLSIANHSASLPIAYRPYLPLEWTADAARRARAGCRKRPDLPASPTSRYHRSAPRGPPVFRRASCRWMPATAATPDCVARLPRSACVISPASSRMPRLGRPGWRRCRRKPWSGRGRPTGRTRRDPEHQPAPAKALARGLPQERGRRSRGARDRRIG
jgi:DDE superfamily endonuclease